MTELKEILEYLDGQIMNESTKGLAFADELVSSFRCEIRKQAFEQVRNWLLLRMLDKAAGQEPESSEKQKV